MKLTIPLFFLMISSFAQPTKKNEREILRIPIKNYESMTSKLGDFTAVVFIRPMSMAEYGDKKYLLSLSYSPILTFYDIDSNQKLSKSILERHLSNVLSQKDQTSNDIQDFHLYKDTLYVRIGEKILLYNFRTEKFIKSFQIEKNDGAFFHKEKLYLNKSNSELKIYQGGKALSSLKFGVGALSTEWFFYENLLFIYDETTGQIASIKLNDLNNSVTKNLVGTVSMDKYLVSVTDRYFVLGYRNRNGRPNRSNILTFVSKNAFETSFEIELDDNALKYGRLDTDVLKPNVDGAPEPHIKPYWTFAGSGNLFFIQFQAEKNLVYKTFELFNPR